MQDQLLLLARKHGWHLQAWAVFSNHYHFVGVAPVEPSSLRTLVRQLHSISAREINRRDSVQQRQVFFQYRDTHLSFERSYLARLNYVNQNAVHHRLVATASEYPWCSARWFEATAPGSFFKVVSSFKIDRVRVADEFDVLDCAGWPPLSRR